MKKLNFFLLTALVVFSAFTLSCSHSKSKQSTDVYGPAVPTSEDKAYDKPFGPDLPMGPLPPEGYHFSGDDGYVVVLSPGLARTAAYIGFFKEVKKVGLPIRAIVATEMGAVISALYACKGLNALEWQFTKFTKEHFLEKKFLQILNSKSKGKKIRSALQSMFKNQTLESCALPLVITRWNVEKNELQMVRQGALAEVLATALMIPEYNEPMATSNTEDKGPYVAAIMEKPCGLDTASSLGLGKTLLVDVLDGAAVTTAPDGDSRDLKMNEIYLQSQGKFRGCAKDADSFLTIKTTGSSFLDFQQRAEFIFLGKQATLKWIKAQKDGSR